jgi:eukaryotic-like serine/threonine-protein kinase
MAAGDPIPPDENYLSSLIEYHESLSGSSVEAEPRPSIEAEPRPSDAGQDPETSARLKRAQGFLRRLHAWADEKSAIRSGQPRGENPDSTSVSSPGPGEAPARVGRFQVVRELGRGAFGIVFLGFDPLLGREVALKIPALQVVATPGLCRRFLREAQAAAGLCHPNLVNVYETGAWGPAAYIATEYCPGETLAAWLQNRAEPVPVAAAATLVATFARALDYAHNQGVIHRDLKPSNIMLVAKAGRSSALSRATDLDELVPKITDFGLAKLLESDPDETRSNAILGTPTYMAPEQADRRLGEVGRPADVHALGTILYELISGRPPFTGATEIETLERVTHDEPQLLRRLRPDVPRDLEAVCLRCLEKKPASRYQTAAALADDLERFLAGRSTKARPVGPLGRSLKAARRHVAVTALLTILVALGVAGLAGHWSQTAQMRRVLALNATIRDQAAGQQRAAQKQLALVQASLVHQYAYARDVSSAAAAWKTGHVADAIRLLARHSPKSGAGDPREFVWRYLWRVCHPDVKFSPDGRTLVTASRDRTVKLSDADAGQTRATIAGLASPPDVLAFWPDASQIAGVIPGPSGDGGKFRAWDVRTGAERGSYVELDGSLGGSTSSIGAALAVRGIIDGNGLGVHVMLADRMSAAQPSWRSMPYLLQPAPEERPVTITCISMSGHLRYLATGHPHGRVTVWALRSGLTRATMNPENAHDVCAVRFSPDASLVAAGSQDGTVRLWTAATGTLRTTFSGHLGAVRSLAFSPDGSILVTASTDRTVRVWNAASGLEQVTLQGHPGEFQTVAFSPDGKTLASGGEGGTFKLWHTATWQELMSIDAHRGGVRFLAFSPDGMLLASSGATSDGRGEIALWRAAATSQADSDRPARSTSTGHPKPGETRKLAVERNPEPNGQK